MTKQKEIIKRLDKLAKELSRIKKYSLAAEAADIMKKLGQVAFSEQEADRLEQAARERSLQQIEQRMSEHVTPTTTSSQSSFLAPAVQGVSTTDTPQITRTQPLPPADGATVNYKVVTSKGDPFTYNFYPTGDAERKIPAGAYQVASVRKGLESKTFTEGPKSGKTYSSSVGEWINPTDLNYKKFIDTLRANNVSSDLLPKASSQKPEYLQKLASLTDAYSAVISQADKSPFGRK